MAECTCDTFMDDAGYISILQCNLCRAAPQILEALEAVAQHLVINSQGYLRLPDEVLLQIPVALNAARGET